MTLRTFPFLCFLLQMPLLAQDLESFELNDAWLETIHEIAPSSPTESVDGTKNILIFSLHTGYEHWAIPHTEAVLKLLVEKSGAARCTASKDIAMFESGSLENFDAIILNNTCPKSAKRDIFYDVLRENEAMTEEERVLKAARLEANLLDFVRDGGGLMLVHGGATMQNNSEAFSQMSGGSFDFHPKQQPIAVQLVNPDHPLVQAFQGKGFVHTDEPYFYTNAYADKNFRPLLYMEAERLVGLDREAGENIRYLAWIKRYGKGRVFLSAPSHNAQSFENPRLLQFFLDGMQYVLGDLSCDDTPISGETR